MKYFSLFSGAGGFELGMPNGFEPVGFSEIDKHASAVLKYQFPNVRNYGDITKIDWATVPDFDLLVGGSPCQDLSVAGKRAGLTGERSGLFAEYVRALREKQPQNFIWENVKGALSSNNGWDFAEVLNQMAEAGYALWWQVLNAKDFGVPQNRERVFIVGTRSGSPREVFFEQGTTGQDSGEITSTTIDANYSKGLDDHGARTGIAVIDDYNHRVKDDGVVPSVRQTFSTNAPNNGAKILVDFRIRRLTPTECERLMSWPDGWTRYGDYGDGVVKEISNSQRYKMCGNGVVSRVVTSIINEHLALR